MTNVTGIYDKNINKQVEKLMLLAKISVEITTFKINKMTFILLRKNCVNNFTHILAFCQSWRNDKKNRNCHRTV